tara:strand:+ start:1786 stop:2112 length:327 start_codon:yes stop_codon:yes gene_type:complete
MSDNDEIVSRCMGFLNSMAAISQPVDIGFDAASGTAPPSLLDLARGVATGPVDRTPVSLTVVQGPEPKFDLRGTHAVATLQADRRFGVLPLVLICVLAIVVALMLCRH